MGIIRSNIRRLEKFALATLVTSALFGSSASAQGAEGNWGAEGRIGSGQSAYLLRWFSPSVSLVLGGGFSSTSNTATQSNSTSTNRSVSVLALIRKEWGTGRVHPFVGIGPTVNYNRSWNESVSAGTTIEQKNTNTGIGGRFEYGGFASVTSSVDLGIVAAATAQRVENKTTSPFPTVENKTTSNAFGFGNPQFVIRVRF